MHVFLYVPVSVCCLSVCLLLCTSSDVFCVLCSVCAGGWRLESGAAFSRPAGVCSGARRAEEPLILSSGATGHG